MSTKSDLESVKMEITQDEQALKTAEGRLPRLEHMAISAKRELDNVLPRLKQALANAEKDLNTNKTEIERIKIRLLAAKDRFRKLSADLEVEKNMEERREEERKKMEEKKPL